MSLRIESVWKIRRTFCVCSATLTHYFYISLPLKFYFINTGLSRLFQRIRCVVYETAFFASFFPNILYRTERKEINRKEWQKRERASKQVRTICRIFWQQRGRLQIFHSHFVFVSFSFLWFALNRECVWEYVFIECRDDKSTKIGKKEKRKKK